MSASSKLTAASVQQDRGGISNEWEQVLNALEVFQNAQVQCGADSCPCLHLQDCVQQLVAKVAKQQPGLDVLLELHVHSTLTGHSITAIQDCPHAAAARLALAEAYYK